MHFYGHPCPRYKLTSYLCEWKKAMLHRSGTFGEDPVADVLLEMVNTTSHHAEQLWDVHTLLGKLEVARNSDHFMAHADLWLCSGPAVLCALLRTVEPQKPMILWHCRHLLDGMGALPNSTRASILMMLRTMAGAASGIAFVACESFAALQAARQLGLSPMPVHQRLGIYAADFSWQGLSPSGRPNHVLLFHR